MYLEIRYLILLPFIVLACMDLHAQSEDQHIFGFKAGLNYSTLYTTDSSLDPKLGYHIGVFSYSYINKSLDYGMEIQYTSQGAQMTSGSSPKLNYNYLTMSFLLKLYPTPDRSICIHGGPQFGYMVSGKVNDQNVINYLHRADLSVSLGVGKKLGNNFEVAARYNYGISDTNSYSVNSDDRLPNRVTQVSLYYSLRSGVANK